MKTTLDLPDDLMRELKILAAQQGKKLKDIVAESLRHGLSHKATNSRASRAVITRDPEFGHLVVQSPSDAPISTMTIEEILKLENEALYQEDLQRVGITF
jgi:hypothetical protein